MQKKHWSRREVLEAFGVGGVTMALPPLEIFLDNHPRLGIRRVSAQSIKARNLVLFEWPNGVPGNYFKYGDANTDILGPLKMHQSRIINPTGLGTSDLGTGNDFNSSRPHAFSMITTLTGSLLGTLPRNESIDVVVEAATYDALPEAQRAGKTRPRPLVIATARRDNVEEMSLSYERVNGSISGIVPQTSLLDVFNSLVAPRVVNGNTATSLKTQRRLKDIEFIRNQIQVTKKKLGRADSQRLDEHISELDRLRGSLMNTSAVAACVNPSAPKTSGKQSLQYGEGNVSDQAFNDIVDLAYQVVRCDVRRAVLLSMGPAGSYPSYVPGQFDAFQAFIGEKIYGEQHELSHDRAQGNVGWAKVLRFTMSKLSRLMDNLTQQDPLTKQSLLDTTAFCAFSEMSDGGSHSSSRLPVLLAGGGWKKGAPNTLAAPGARIGDLWLTAAHNMGVNINSFGHSQGVISALEL